MRGRLRPHGGLLWVLVACAGLGFTMTGVPGPVSAQSSRSDSGRLGMVETAPGRLSIDVQGAEIRTLLRAFSEFSGRNIVVGKLVKGKVSFRVTDTPWRDAMVSVLRANGLDLVEESGSIRIDSAEKLQAELLARETNAARRLEVQRMETRVLNVSYANARELQAVLQTVLSKRGQIQVDPRTNSLVVTDIPEKLDATEKMVAELDRRTPQIEIVAKLVDVDVSALREFGVRWSSGETATGELKPFNLGGDFEAESEISAEISDPVARLKIATMGKDGDLDLELQALELQRKADIISNPRITTMDNREATIIVGQKIPLIVQDIAGNAVQQLTTIGIQLRVTPHITADNMIVLDIHSEVSDLSTQSTVQGGIIINTAEADTRVMVEDGQTAVIGGLIRNNESRVRTGVPILMDIPLIGALFSRTSTIKQKRELVIFVTPRLVKDI